MTTLDVLAEGRGEYLKVDPDDPESVKLIYPTNTEMLTLVTCGGTFQRDPSARFGGEYTHRSIVQAKPVT